jgi:deoxyribodipyrimidine photo-lyase
MNCAGRFSLVTASGADAAPCFRVFNPVIQGKSSIHAATVWAVGAQWIHWPKEAPPEVLCAAGAGLRQSYPHPIVSHAIAREVALEAFVRIKSTNPART